MKSKSIRRRCRHCGGMFTSDHRNQDRQYYCSTPVCRRISKFASQRRWSRKTESLAHYQERRKCGACRNGGKRTRVIGRKKATVQRSASRCPTSGYHCLLGALDTRRSSSELMQDMVEKVFEVCRGLGPLNSWVGFVVQVVPELEGHNCDPP